MQAGQLVNPQRGPRYIPFACAALLAAASVLLPFFIPVLHGVPFACSFVAIAAVAHFWGFGPALLSAVISLIGVNALVMGTRYHFELDAASLIQTAVCGVVAVILARLVQQRDVARTAEQRSHASLDAALRSISDAVVVTDTAAHIVFLNPAAERLTGWPADTAIGKPIHEVLIFRDETTGKPVENPVDLVLSTGVIVGLANHTVLVRKDGSELPIDDSAAPTRDVAGQVTGAVLVFRDIGERRQLERQRDASLIQAQRAAEFFRLSAQASLVAAWDYDYATETANWAEGSYPVWGVSFDEVKTLEGMFARIVAEYREPIRAEIARCIESHDNYCVEFPLIAAEGSDPRWCESRGVPMVHEEGRVIGLRGTTIDITHRKLSEQALLRSEKLAAAGRLAASVAHEINNPLESAINLVYLALMQARRSQENDEYLRQAELQLKRVSHIARQSLSFYRDSLSPALYRPAESIRDVVSVLQLRGGAETVRLECRLDEYLQVFGRAGDLRQIASNLIGNAIDAVVRSASASLLEGAGRVAVRLRQLPALHPGALGGLVLTVADNGPGIPWQTQQKIFEAFFTTKPETGTGLGLWVTRSLVERSGGSIRVRSSTKRFHHGTIFRVQLPSLTTPPATRAKSVVI